MTKRPNYWYDATVDVRVYLNGYPDDMSEDDVELAVQGTVDEAHEAVVVHQLAGGREYRSPLLSGVVLSCHGVDLGELQGAEEDVET